MAIGPQSQPFLETLDAAERAALLSAGRGRRWERGELLVRAGDAAESALEDVDGVVISVAALRGFLAAPADAALPCST